MNLNNFGPRLRVNKNNKEKKNSEKEVFIETIETLDQLWLRTNFLHDHLKIDFYNYEGNYYNVIENLIYLKYGEELANLILWYIYDRFDEENNILGLEVTLPGKDKKTYILKTPTDLWNLVNKIIKATNK